MSETCVEEAVVVQCCNLGSSAVAKSPVGADITALVLGLLGEPILSDTGTAWLLDSQNTSPVFSRPTGYFSHMLNHLHDALLACCVQQGLYGPTSRPC